MIFKHVPLETQVWVNRSELLKVLAFQKTLQGTSFPAIRYWMTRESEVFLEIEHVTRRTCAMRGGFAGNVDQLRETAVAEGKSPDEIAALEPEMKRKASQEWWLSEKRSRAACAANAGLCTPALYSSASGCT